MVLDQDQPVGSVDSGTTPALLVNEWFGTSQTDWIGYGGILVSGVGLGFTYFQARRAANAAASAERAARRTSRALAVAQMLSAIPELSRIDANLDVAVQDENRGATLDALREWRSKAGDLRGLIMAASTDEHVRIGTEIQKSIGAANQAKIALQDEGGHPLRSTKQCRLAMATVLESVSVLAGQLKGASLKDEPNGK